MIGFSKNFFAHKSKQASAGQARLPEATGVTPDSLNDELSGLVFNQALYGYTSIFDGFLISDGAKYIADNYNLYTFMDIICAYQVLEGMPTVQVWELNRYTYNELMLPYIAFRNKPWKLTYYNDNSFLATCTDMEHNVLQKQFITHYPFIKSHVKVLLVGNVIMLPSEHT
jgi:hypothetical protein